MATDSEVAATYAPLSSPALTGSPTVPTAIAASSNTVAASTAYVDRAVAAGGGGGGGLSDGGTAASLTITNLTASTINVADQTRTNLNYSSFADYDPVSVEFIHGASVTATGGLPWFSGAAISSGTQATVADETNRIGIVSMSSASGANSGWYYLSQAVQMFAQPGMTWESSTKVSNTNAGARTSIGFTDTTTLGNPIDGIRVWRSNNVVYGQIYNSSSLTQTTGSATVASNQWLDVKIQIVATNQVAFDVWDGTSNTSLLSETVTVALPSTSARVFGMGIISGYTNAAIVIGDYIDKMRFTVNKAMAR
jgi:hypothetical protein